MYEFDSVSVSSFEAGSLAATLTERSADGWDVVAIVTAGSDVVAYLRRAIASTGAAEGSAVETPTTAADLLVASTAATPVTDTASNGPAGEDSSAGWAATTDSSTSGWAAQSSASPSSTSQASTSQASAPAASTSSWGGSSQQAAAAQPAATPQVPAGWYADPAGRYELRYWDGGAWTEHVSRAGQQYTDPPVA